MGMLEKIQKMKKSDARIWKYEKVGDCLAGEVVTPLRVVETVYGESRVIDVKSEADGEIYRVWALTVIGNELKRQLVEVGDVVGIKYLGEIKNYKDFLVVVEKKKGRPTKGSPINGQSEDTGKGASKTDEDIPF